MLTSKIVGSGCVSENGRGLWSPQKKSYRNGQTWQQARQIGDRRLNLEIWRTWFSHACLYGSCSFHDVQLGKTDDEYECNRRESSVKQEPALGIFLETPLQNDYPTKKKHQTFFSPSRNFQHPPPNPTNGYPVPSLSLDRRWRPADVCSRLLNLLVRPFPILLGSGPWWRG